MKRLNEKGFATSSIIYSLLILFVFLALGVLALFANSKMVFDKMKTDMLASLNGVDKVVITPNAEYVVADFGSKDDILSTYFNFRLIGESPILTKICIDKSRSDTQVVNVEELSIGQHEIECTIIKENGYSKSATINITIDSDYVCSSVTNTTGGKIAFGDYLLGDEYECNPGDGIGRRFYVIGSNYNNVSLIMNKNIGDNIEYDASGGNLLKEAETQLVSKTNNWNSVTVNFPTKDQIMTAILGSSPSTYNEYSFYKPDYEWILTNTNCLNRSCSEEGTTDTTLGYWISGNVSGGKAWTVDYASMFIKENTNRITKGVRPVITVNKTDIYNALEAIDIPSITVTPSSGWSPSKNVTILFPARMYEVDYEYSTNGINWITLDMSERTVSLPFTEDGYVVARMMVDDKLIHSVTTNIGNIDTNYPVIVANQTTGIEVKNLNLNIFSSYVTATNVGPSPVLSKICIDTNHASAIVTNINQMTAIGVHNLTCTITKENGLSKSVNISIEIFNKEYVYNFIGDYQIFTAPKNGYYHLEAWGASGGYWNTNYVPGRGAYTRGTIYLAKGTNIYVYVGGNTNSFNGGAIGGSLNITYSGGGATDFRLESGAWNSTTGLRSRIMVAGAGGGTGETTTVRAGDAGGLYGGGSSLSYSGGGASQTSGGYGYPNGDMSGSYGSFGIGGQGGLETCCARGGAGGAGYYGGGGGAGIAGADGAGGGGSSFISGHSGCNAVNSSGVHTGIPNHYSGRVFINTTMRSGSEEMPTISGTQTKIGNDGNGWAKITYVGDIPYDLGESTEYVYNGSTQTFVSPVTGKYKLEVWGASGGGYTSSYETNGGRGGYSVGTVNLNVGTILYIYAGGEGGYTYTNGGFNGGGNSYAYGGSGGGASDIRIGTDSLYSRVIVAGGGGGGGFTTRIGGYGGGTYGGDGDPGTATPGGGGTATYGGTTGSGGVVGVFGGAQDRSSDAGTGGGGGGGWYGGGSGMSSSADSGGGGGSGYVYTSSTASQCPSGCLLVPSYYLSNASTYRGNTTFLSPEGNNVVGHTGNGYVRITLISQS